MNKKKYCLIDGVLFFADFHLHLSFLISFRSVPYAGSYWKDFSDLSGFNSISLLSAAWLQSRMLFKNLFINNDLNATVFNTDISERFLTENHLAIGSLSTWLLFAFILFFCGVLGMIFNYKNFLVTMMSVELMYLGAVSSFVLYGTVTHDTRGSIYGLLFLILAACESAIGLGILIVLYRFGRTIDFSAYQHLGG